MKYHLLRSISPFKRHLLGLLLVASTLAWPVPSVAAPAATPTAAGGPDAPPPAATAKEIELGDKAAAELEKNPKVKLLDGSKDAAGKLLLAKLNGMAEEFGKASRRPLIKYSVKVIEDKDS